MELLQHQSILLHVVVHCLHVDFDVVFELDQLGKQSLDCVLDDLPVGSGFSGDLLLPQFLDVDDDFEELLLDSLLELELEEPIDLFGLLEERLFVGFHQAHYQRELLGGYAGNQLIQHEHCCFVVELAQSEEDFLEESRVEVVVLPLRNKLFFEVLVEFHWVFITREIIGFGEAELKLADF